MKKVGLQKMPTASKVIRFLIRRRLSYFLPLPKSRALLKMFFHKSLNWQGSTCYEMHEMRLGTPCGNAFLR